MLYFKLIPSKIKDKLFYVTPISIGQVTHMIFMLICNYRNEVLWPISCTGPTGFEWLSNHWSMTDEKNSQILPYCISKPGCRHDFIYTLLLQPSGEQNCCCQISTIGLTLLMCGWGGVGLVGLGSMLPLESRLAYGIRGAERLLIPSGTPRIPLVLTLKEEHSLQIGLGRRCSHDK